MKTTLYPTGQHLVEVPCNTCAATYSLSEVAAKVAEKLKLPFHQLAMDEKLVKIAEEWQITQVPALVLINEGEIVGKVHGYQPEEILEIYVKSKLNLKENV